MLKIKPRFELDVGRDAGKIQIHLIIKQEVVKRDLDFEGGNLKLDNSTSEVERAEVPSFRPKQLACQSTCRKASPNLLADSTSDKGPF